MGSTASMSLAAVLRDARVVTHPWIIGELACGGIRNRREILSLLQSLPAVRPVDDAEALAFIESHGLMGIGLGYTDVHLLAASALERVPLWTRDKAVKMAARRLNLAFESML
jgi:predicted nucleic acid-binding protein